ncbi:MAG TPA: hypothetical protein VFP35_02740 [Candidatus Saccharimonadales bacterium]|nr:hypothetical protein [Candidatus Saccharimonadales bacterium]
MIPYVDFSFNKRPFASKNPFEMHDEPLTIFIDRASFKGTPKKLKVLLMQASENLNIVSPKKEGSAHLEYMDRDDDVLGFTVTQLDSTSIGHHGIPSISQYDRLSKVPDFTRWATSGEIYRAFIAARTAEALGAILITQDKFLLEHKAIGIIGDAYPLTIDEGMALIGLVQRRRNNFEIVTRVGVPKYTYNYSRWLYFWYASRDLLPSGWRLVTGSAQVPDDYKCRDLSLTVIARLSSVLKCRDHIHEQLYLEQTNSSTEDAIFYLDYYMVSLVAAFDVLARVAHAIYQPSTRATVTWRGSAHGRSWLSALTTQDASLASLMQPTAFCRDVLDFVAILRNFIHAEGLQGATHTKNGKRAPTLLHVPEGEVTRIFDIIQRLGPTNWNIDRPRPNVMFLEIGNLVENITPLAAEALETIMKNIDVTRVPGYDPTKVQTRPPSKWATKDDLAMIRAFLGL